MSKEEKTKKKQRLKLKEKEEKYPRYRLTIEELEQIKREYDRDFNPATPEEITHYVKRDISTQLQGMKSQLQLYLESDEYTMYKTLTDQYRFAIYRYGDALSNARHLGTQVAKEDAIKARKELQKVYTELKQFRKIRHQVKQYQEKIAFLESLTPADVVFLESH